LGESETNFKWDQGRKRGIDENPGGDGIFWGVREPNKLAVTENFENEKKTGTR